MSEAQAKSMAEAKESIYGKARQRWRLERMFAAFGVVLPVVCLLLAVAVLMTCIYAKAALLFPLCAAIFGVILLGTLAYGWFAPIQQQRLWARLDRVANLKDGVLTLEELALQRVDTDWAKTQRARVIKDLSWERIRSGWPLHFPRTTQYAGILCIVLIAFFATGFYSYKPSSEEVATKAMMDDQAKAIEQIAKDWEQVQKEQPSEELQRALEELKPLRDRLAKGDMTEKELMQELSRVESRLEAMQKEAKDEAMDPSLAKELAEALEPLQGTAGLNAALKKNDMQEAEKQAEELAKNWEKPDAKILKEKLTAEEKDKLDKAADRADAAKMDKIASSLREMSKEASSAESKSAQGQKGECKADGKKMSESMKGVQSGLSKASKSQGKSIKLSVQLMQLGQCKSCMSNCQSPNVCISLFQKMCQKPGGSKAGTASGGNPLGAATKTAVDLKQENLTGTMGEGDSEVTTETTNEPTPAGPLTAKTASFRSYEKLSKVAIEDENLPLAHRESIKRYFESIRPKDSK